MPTEKTRICLTLDSDLKRKLEQLADAEKRSTNSEIGHLLELAVRAREKEAK
jgi:hypothetical protein